MAETKKRETRISGPASGGAWTSDTALSSAARERAIRPRARLQARSVGHASRAPSPAEPGRAIKP